MQRLFLILFTLALGACKEIPVDLGIPLAVDHTAVDSFSTLTSDQTNAVKSKLKILFAHASVGGNVVDGMADLQTIDAGGKYNLPIGSGSLAELKTYFSTQKGLGDYFQGNPPDQPGLPSWKLKINYFTSDFQTDGMGSAVNVAMMKFCYIDPDASFADYCDAMEALEKAYPQVKFIWWTMPLETSGDPKKNSFNAQVRQHCQIKGKILFDIADIESHDPSGNAQSDANGERLYDGYSTDGGHLNDGAKQGRQRAAKALWVLLSQIAEVYF